MYGTERPASAATDATVRPAAVRRAIPAHIFLVTGSLRATGLTVAAEYLPLLLGPVAGVFADRWDRRRLMIGTNLFCAGAVAMTLAGLAPGRYGVLYAALVAENAGLVLYAPAARALFPVTVVFLAANASLSAVLIPFGIQRLGGSEHTGFLLCGLGAGFLAGAPVIRLLLDRAQTRILLAASLAATAAAYAGLFSSTSLAMALPAAAAVGMFGSMSLVIPQTTVQRVIPNAVLGRIGAVFLTGEAAATLAGAAAGPFLAQAAGLTAVAAVAALVTLTAAGLARLLVPPLYPVTCP